MQRTIATLGPQRRVLYLQIASLGDGRCERRAERVLLRGLERRWPEAALEHLLTLLLERARAAPAGSRRAGR